MVKLGKLKEVQVRELWKGEATHFTPWLAKEENIALLSDEISIDLEVLEQEKNVGPYRADILCKDSSSGHYVLIENQLEKTDHIHLGQLLTYASGLDAVTIIWIAKKFTEEHRAVLDWLNRITEEGLNFFGIEIKAYKIGNSYPAPKFDIVSKPNDWSKYVKKTAGKNGPTETNLMQLEYWDKFKEFLENSTSRLNSRKPYKNWTSFATGKSGVNLNAAINSFKKQIQIKLEITGAKRYERYNYLKETFEDDSYIKISDEIQWRDKVTIIQLNKSADYTVKDDWENQFEWFKNYLEKYVKFFKPKLKDLE